MTHGSLFSGIGGFDLAAEWMGWQNVFHCEWNEFGQKVLKHYWPKAISYHDITKTDFTIHRGTIDILTGGFPCQPYSTAGKRKGKEDERHLWPEMLRAIREIQPRWVVGENVLGLVNWSEGLVFHEVQTDLEASGYEVFPYVLNAASVGAPHKRDRIWFVAYATGNGYKNGCKETGGEERCSEQWGVQQFEGMGREWDAADTLCNRIGKSRERGQSKQFDKNGIEGRTITNTESIGQEYALENGELERGRFRQSNKRNAWDSFPSVSPICTRDDGISTRLDGITFPKWRNESIKAAGNAIVPQVCLQIFKAIQEFENKINEQE